MNRILANAERTPRRIPPALLLDVAKFLHELHLQEKGDDLSPAATVERAYKFLDTLLSSDRGLIFTMTNPRLCGCVVLQFDALPFANTMLISGLCVTPNAPRHTVLQMMMAIICEADEREIKHLYLLAGTDKNRSRKTYARLGFRDTGLTEAGSHLMTASVTDACRRLEQMTRGKMGM